MVVAFLVVRLVAWRNGLRFDSNALHYWHVLDEDLLRHDLLRSLFALHAQPPLYNLFLGLALQSLPGAAFGPVVATVFRSLSLAGMVGSYGLLRELGSKPIVASPTAWAVWATPTALVYENSLFYTTPVTVLLVLATWMLARAARTGSCAALWGFTFAVIGLALTRATFHPVWVVLAFGPALFLGARRRTTMTCAVVAVVVVGSLCVKNGLLVGSWSTSSWLGMNLARMTTDRIPIEERRATARAGDLDPVCVRPSFSGIESYPRKLTVVRGPDLPALRRLRKADGGANYNHARFADASRHLRACAVRVIREQPAIYVASVKEATTAFLKPPADWFMVHAQKTALGRYERFYARWILGARKTGVSWLYFVLLAVTLGGAIVAFDHRRTTGPARLVPLLFASGTIVFLSAVAILADVGENMRFRGEIEPLLQTVGLFVVVSIGHRAWRRVGHAVSSASPCRTRGRPRRG